MTASKLVTLQGGDRESIGESDEKLPESLPAMNSVAAHETVDVEFAASSLPTASPVAVSLVEKVAKVVSGISVIGEARNALEAVGWTATIAANRITVDDEVLVQFIPAKVGTFGPIDASWIVYAIAGTPPVWIVGTEQSDRSDSLTGAGR